MTHPRELIIPMMDILASEPVKQHIVLVGDVGTKYPNLPLKQRISRIDGYTTHPAFEVSKQHIQTYTLKPNCSASKALEELLTTYEMVVDCSASMVIAYYLAVLRSMQANEGPVIGAAHFDCFFGSDDPEVAIPEWGRLKISQAGPMMGTDKCPWKGGQYDKPFPFQPLSFIFDFVTCARKDEFYQNAQVGSLFAFVGDMDYLKAHPMGAEGGYNCCVYSQRPFLVRIAESALPCTESSLKERHIAAYRQLPSEESSHVAKNENLRHHQSKPEADPNKILGYTPYMMNMNEDRVNSLLHKPLDESLREYQFHYFAQEDKVQKRALMSKISEGVFFDGSAMLPMLQLAAELAAQESAGSRSTVVGSASDQVKPNIVNKDSKSNKY